MSLNVSQHTWLLLKFLIRNVFLSYSYHTPAPARSPLSPYQSQASACPGVWLAYLVTLHWRIIDFPFERRHQLETGTWLGVLFCVRAPIFGMGLLFALNLCRSWASWFYFLDKWTSNLSHLHIRVLSARIQNRSHHVYRRNLHYPTDYQPVWGLNSQSHYVFSLLPIQSGFYKCFLKTWFSAISLSNVLNNIYLHSPIICG